MHQTPLVSIVIPTYNRWHVIGEAITSVLDQTYTNWELIVVDDGSTDETVTRFPQTYGQDERIVFKQVENGGAARARNIGAKMAGGELLTFLDSDDVATEGWLQSLVEAFTTSSASLVSCGTERFRLDENLGTVMPRKKPYTYHGYTAKITNGGSFLLPRELFWTIGGYDEELRSGQHTEMGFRLTQYMRENGLKATVVNEPLVKIIDRGGDSIRKNDKAVYTGVTYFIDKHGEYMRQLSPEFLATYLAIAGERASRIQLHKEASRYYYRAWALRPTDPKALGRLLKSYFKTV